MISISPTAMEVSRIKEMNNGVLGFWRVGVLLILLPALVIGAGCAAGAIAAAIPGYLKAKRGVHEVISTIMLNFVALGLVGYVVQGPLMEAAGRYPQTDALLTAFWMPRLGVHRVHLGVVLALAAAAALHVLLYRSVAGYEMRAAGLNREGAMVLFTNGGRSMIGLPELQAGEAMAVKSPDNITGVGTNARNELGVWRVIVP